VNLLLFGGFFRRILVVFTLFVHRNMKEAGFYKSDADETARGST
jgi:hypothetical protein